MRMVFLALLLSVSSAFGQTGPGNCPANTVVGNIGGGTTCLPSPKISTLNFVAAASNGINDQSAVSGSGATFWPSSGPAIVHRMNRLMVGVAASGNLSPPGNTWVDSLTGNFSELANITVLGTLFSGLNAASRTSDTIASGVGTPSGGTAGAYLIGYNDNNTVGNIALGSNSVGFAKSGTSGIVLGAQQDINCATTAYVSNPASTENPSGGTCIGLLITAGAYAFATTNASAGIVISNGTSKVFGKGIVVGFNALDSTQGNGGAGVAMEMYPGHTLRWFNGTTAYLEFGTTGAGVPAFVTNGGAQFAINGVATVSCTAGTVNGATITVTNGWVTHC